MTTQTLLLEWLEKFQKEHIKARTYNRYQGLIGSFRYKLRPHGYQIYSGQNGAFCHEG